MHPILFKIGSFEIFTYGLMMALGALAGIIAVNGEAKRLGLNQDQMTVSSVLTFLMGLVGSRILYVITRISDPRVDLVTVLFNFRAGFVYYGGLISSWLFLVWYIRKKKWPFWDVCDAYAMGICIGLAIGRIGCLAGGCCYGSATTLPWAVVMEKHTELGTLHPVQGYEFFFLVVLFAAMWWRRSRKKYSGELVVWFVGLYAIARYLLEFIRGDLIRGYLVDEWMTTSQAISVPMLVLALVLHFRLKRRK